MSLFRLSRIVKTRLERIQRDFPRGGGALEKKTSSGQLAHSVSSEKERGLRSKGQSNLNRELLSKWNWRFAHERDSLWRSVIGTKFGEDVGGLVYTRFQGTLRYWLMERDKK